MEENISRNSGPEVETLTLEREKIKLEREKLAVERYKARWTAISIAVPLLVAVITFGYSSYLENKRTEAGFKLKVFEVLLSDPTNAHFRALMLRDVFSFKVDSDVIEGLENYEKQVYRQEIKLNMFRVYANSNRTKEELITTYNQLFPDNYVTINMQKQEGDAGPASPPNNGMQRTRK